MGTQIVSLLTSAGGGGGSLPPKVISVPADFPTLIEANADIGRIYIAAANVTDNDPTKTNTGQSFLSGEEFVWDGISVYAKLGANALWLDDGTDYKTISPPRNLDLQNKELKNVSKGWFTNLEITNYPSVNGTPLSDQYLATTDSPTFVGETLSGLSVLGGIVQTNGSGVLSSSVTLPDGTLATTQSPLDDSTKLATTAYVDAAVVVENLWNRVTGLTNYLEPTNANDAVIITKSTNATQDSIIKTVMTLIADVDGVAGNVSEITGYASGMTALHEVIGYKAVLNVSASDTAGWYSAFKAEDVIPHTGVSVAYGLRVGKEYDVALFLESGTILINDDYDDVIACYRESAGDGTNFSISAADGVASAAEARAGGDFRIYSGAGVNAGDAGEIQFYFGTTLKAKFNPDGHLHLNDEESASFATSEFQVFKNSAPDVSLWSASVTAGTDANLNLIRSRGTIGTPFAVVDDDLIGNINFIALSGGSTFNNGAEIRAEINGTPSTGVLPCDLVFYVNAGAGVATEGMRLLKTKDLLVFGDIVSSTNLDIASSSGTGFTRILDENGNPVFSYDNALNKFTFNDDIEVTIGGEIKVNTINTYNAIAGVTVEGVELLSGAIKADSIAELTGSAGVIIEDLLHIDEAIQGSNITLTAVSGTLALDSATSLTIQSDNSYTINPDKTDADITILSVNSDNLMFFDMGNDRIGILNAAPTSELDVTGSGKFSANLTVANNVTFQAGYTGSITTVNAATYNLLATDYILSVYYTLTGACAISLPSAQALVGRIIHVKDRYGNASVNNITITPTGGRLIDGGASVTITGDYEALAIYSDGTNWYVF